MDWLKIINFIIAVLFTVCYAYQYVYIIVGCFVKPHIFRQVKPQHRFAILISARNEQSVIGHLLDSIGAQSYPQELIDTYVIADNCTDATGAIAKEHGAIVYERNDLCNVGKGYALAFLFDHLQKEQSFERYDGFFVIDADNILHPDFVREMDKCMSEGHRIITCYRNSKNYGTNWITAGYALWFLREARHLNNPRFILGTSCAVSGTGFLVHKDVIRRQGGWKHFLLTEDIEFSVDSILHGEKIAYCHKAMLYDEQPITFRQSWRQRMRWSKGFLQVVRKYGTKLVSGIFHGKGFSCLDMLFTIAPAFIISTVSLLTNLTGLIVGLATTPQNLLTALVEIGKMLGGVYVILFTGGLISGCFEWKNIHTTTPRKILSFFTFPLFMMTYLPISLVALFAKVSWKPIDHTVACTLENIENNASQN